MTRARDRKENDPELLSGLSGRKRPLTVECVGSAVTLKKILGQADMSVAKSRRAVKGARNLPSVARH